MITHPTVLNYLTEARTVEIGAVRTASPAPARHTPPVRRSMLARMIVIFHYIESALARALPFTA